MTFEQLSAFTVSDDHKRQEQVWENLLHWDRQVHRIKSGLVTDEVASTDRRVKLIGGLDIQFSLLHIPATVLVGDSLTMRFHEEWHTLAHVMGGWNAKLRTAEREEKVTAPTISPTAPGNDGTQAAEPRAAKPNEPSFGVEKTGQLRLF